jgi:hypothetical protein
LEIFEEAGQGPADQTLLRQPSLEPALFHVTVAQRHRTSFNVALPHSSGVERPLMKRVSLWVRPANPKYQFSCSTEMVVDRQPGSLNAHKRDRRDLPLTSQEQK